MLDETDTLETYKDALVPMNAEIFSSVDPIVWLKNASRFLSLLGGGGMAAP